VAEAFCRYMYPGLLSPEGLDVAVTRARTQLASDYGESDRSWLTPTVYWRCRDGQVFRRIASSLAGASEQQIQDLEVEIQLWRTTLASLQQEIAALPLQQQKSRQSVLKDYQNRLKGAIARQAAILGNAVIIEPADSVSLADGASLADAEPAQPFTNRIL